MGFDVGKTRDRVKKISPIYKDGQPLNLEYRCDRFTAQEQADFQDELLRLNEKDEQGNHKHEDSQRQVITKLAWYLKETLSSADWQDADGAIPIDELEMVKRLPFNVLMFTFEKINEDKSAKK